METEFEPKRIKRQKRRNPLGKEVRDPNGLYTMRVVEDKQKYKRKPKYAQNYLDEE